MGVALLALGYLGARGTSLFAVRSVHVSGAAPDVERAVGEAASFVHGRSLVGLDGEGLERRLRALPSVVSVEVDRAFPRTIRIAVEPERPVAVVRAGREAWIVSARARVIRQVEAATVGKLPRVWLPSSNVLEEGTTLRLDQGAIAVRALARLPRDFPARVTMAREQEGFVTFVLGGRTELRLGDADRLKLKLAVAGRILDRLTVADRYSIDYLDVSLPERVVAGAESQLVS